MVMDGPNVHIGAHNSVSMELKIVMTRDFSHCSALTITHHSKGIKEIVKIKDLMIGLGRDLSNSHQKMMEYRGVFYALLEDVVVFEICPATRWTYLKKTGEKLIKALFEVITYLENSVERVLAVKRKILRLGQG